jgi:uncharacterized SAM-binding protein YcdF (DUF218 family)
MRALILLGSGWIVCLAAIVGWSMRSSSGKADAIVVLGAAQYSGRPSRVLSARLDHALELWQRARAPRIVLTGGQRPGDLLSEAAAGRRYVMRRGVPANAILLEKTGRTSLASVHGAAVLLHAQHDSLQRARARGAKGSEAIQAPISDRPRVLLVSDPFHMLRLDLLARLHGLDPLSSPTRTSPISANRSVAIEYILRESIALPTDIALLLWLHLTGHSSAPNADG